MGQLLVCYVPDMFYLVTPYETGLVDNAVYDFK